MIIFYSVCIIISFLHCFVRIIHSFLLDVYLSTTVCSVVFVSFFRSFSLLFVLFIYSFTSLILLYNSLVNIACFVVLIPLFRTFILPICIISSFILSNHSLGHIIIFIALRITFYYVILSFEFIISYHSFVHIIMFGSIASFFVRVIHSFFHSIHSFPSLRSVAFVRYFIILLQFFLLPYSFISFFIFGNIRIIFCCFILSYELIASYPELLISLKERVIFFSENMHFVSSQVL